MFDPLKGSLAAVEAKLEGALALLRTEIAAVEAELALLEQDALAPLARVEASAAEASGGVSASLGPIRMDVGSLLPPGP